MSQPFNRSCKLSSPGEPDRELGEFWVGNPWDIAPTHNLSAYERNRTFWNQEGRGFIDISGLTGADSEGDGRSAVAADFDNDGRLDLVVRQAGGGALQLFHNEFEPRNWLRVTLRGTESNKLGIGARLVARVGDRTIHRDLSAVNSYYSRAPALVHFGLGDADAIDELTVQWPSGKTQRFLDVAVNRQIVLTEDSSAVVEAVAGEVIEP